MKELTRILLKKRIKNLIEGVFYTSFLSSLAKATDKLIGRSKVTILLYHNIVEKTPYNPTYFQKVCVTKEEFIHQMEFIAKNNTVISLSRYVVILKNSRQELPGDRPVIIITFDDGYESVYTTAYPVLKKYNFPATIFVPTGFIGKREALPGESHYPGINYTKLSWEQIKELYQNGFEIGSHTVTHVRPTNNNYKSYMMEIIASVSEIKRQLNIKSVHFSRPYGKQDDFICKFESFYRENDILSASYAFGGKNYAKTNPYHLNRIGISTGISKIHFQNIANGVNPSDFLTRKG